MSTTDHIAAVNTSREAMPSYTQPCQVIHSRKSPMSSSNHTTTLAYTCTCITGYVGTGQEMVIERFNAKPNRYYLHDAYHALIRFDFFSGMEGSYAGTHDCFCMLLAVIPTALVSSVLTESQGSLSYSD